MDDFVNLILAGIALEAAFQILRPIWEPEVRKQWNFTRLLMLFLALGLVISFSDWNLVSGSGLDFGNQWVGKALSALALVRITQWVHEVYKKTSR
jgi:hypothetical protein